MATFPGGIASLTNPEYNSRMNILSHAAQHTSANDEIEAIETALGAGFGKATSAEVTTGTDDAKFTTPKALKDAGIVATTTPTFGSWVDKSSSYAAQQATTDGFVVMILSPESCWESGMTLRGYSDSNSNPTTLRVGVDWSGNGSGGAMTRSATMPVKKNDYWKMTTTAYGNAGSYNITVYWIPSGT
jgi:hypothetical protein